MMLHSHLGKHAFGVMAISTSDGVKVVDAAWISSERRALNIGKQIATLAPEIVVEVMSPNNSETHMAYKPALYFEAGAEEFWLCDASGRLRFYLNEKGNAIENGHSMRCPQFPRVIAE